MSNATVVNWDKVKTGDYCIGISPTGVFFLTRAKAVHCAATNDVDLGPRCLLETMITPSSVSTFLECARGMTDEDWNLPHFPRVSDRPWNGPKPSRMVYAIRHDRIPTDEDCAVLSKCLNTAMRNLLR